MSKHHVPPNTNKATHTSAKALDVPVSAPDADGFVTSPLFDGTPLEGSRWSFDEIRKRPGQTPQQQANSDVNDVENMAQTQTVDTTNPFDTAWFTPGVNANVAKLESGHYAPFPNVFVARGAHRDLARFEISDLPAAIAYWKDTNVWPKSAHDEGAVAGAG